MIKYADRGLVENGTIKKLFDYLYYISSVAWFFCGLGIPFGLYFSKGWEAETTMKYLNRCKTNYQNFDDGSKVIKTEMILAIIIFIPAVIMFLAIRYFVSKRSKDHKVPAIFGRYQRNLLTFNQTVMFLISFIFHEVVLASMLSFLENNVSR